MGLVERGRGKGRLLPDRSDTGPVTWKWCWLRRFLLLAGRLLAACCQEEKMTKDLLVVLVVDQTACHQEGGWSIRYLQLFCNCLIKKILKYPLHNTLLVVNIFPWIFTWIHFVLSCVWHWLTGSMWLSMWKSFGNHFSIKRRNHKTLAKKAHYFKVSTLQTGTRW